MTDYVLGLQFNHERHMVLLLEKRRPEWQRGQYNGVGGKIEPGETALEAMCREWHEETGMMQCHKWHNFARLEAPGVYSVEFFRSFSSLELMLEAGLYTLAHPALEQIGVFPIKHLPRTIPNTEWFIRMALNFDRDHVTKFIVTEVKELAA